MKRILLIAVLTLFLSGCAVHVFEGRPRVASILYRTGHVHTIASPHVIVTHPHSRRIITRNYHNHNYTSNHYHNHPAKKRYKKKYRKH